MRAQVAALEEYKLVRREDFGTGDRPRLIMLKDDGSGDPLDDPDGRTGSSYVTIHGSVLSAPTFLEWGAPELFAYLCAMVAGRYAANKQGGDPASVTWFQATKWFTTDETARPSTHVLFPIGAKRIQRGLRRLTEQGWIQATKTIRDPRGGAASLQEAEERLPEPFRPTRRDSARGRSLRGTGASPRMTGRLSA